jgi:hypothetical protein
MVNFVRIFNFLLVTLFISASGYAQTPDLENIPKSILIRKDKNGDVYIHRSHAKLGKLRAGQETKLEKLKWIKLSSLSNQIVLKAPKSPTQELDKDIPRQSWYVYWGYSNGYYLNYPIHYYAYHYRYTFYPYYSYSRAGSSYYWYGWNGRGYYRYN